MTKWTNKKIGSRKCGGIQRNNSREKEKGGELKSGERQTSGLLSADCQRMGGQTGGETFCMMKL